MAGRSPDFAAEIGISTGAGLEAVLRVALIASHGDTGLQLAAHPRGDLIRGGSSP
jgi:hypothetical protein